MREDAETPAVARGAVVVDHDGRVAGLDGPQVYVDDLGLVHGDGLFETLLVRGGRACNLDRHLDRLARGSAAMDLPAPDRRRWTAMIDAGLRAWRETGAAGDREGMARLVRTRGREADPGAGPTEYLTIAPVPDRVAAARRDGVRVVSLPTAVDPDLARRSPWLLAGVKSLSYAVNTAALRHARSFGADDALLLSSTGAVLEGPRGSVVAVVDGRLVTPRRDGGVLPGTTQDALFAAADAAGVPTAECDLDVADLMAADGVWLVSSVTLAARVTHIDGIGVAQGDLPQGDLTGGAVIGVAALVDEAAG
ncbi:aminodeoxychorismate lyase [Gordonia shandongensis]|uniref:aminodeoxychorismate lyase n=1 Tax=Gordonia shandongensis TaxID=376351 RepID=UPI00040EE93C|nr:aminodeoxychorismate lyase [Gordonia shandongensis]